MSIELFVVGVVTVAFVMLQRLLRRMKYGIRRFVITALFGVCAGMVIGVSRALGRDLVEGLQYGALYALLFGFGIAVHTILMHEREERNANSQSCQEP